ncbi:hypothetical protein R1flu_024884 [Riccia fluitans]|uniref:Uncharacterized protein n=1 Tax=Riccia fluitans TaxID=41844 RepID=A0ABD1XW55_9MARC
MALQAARSLLHTNIDEKETLLIARALLQSRIDESHSSSNDFEASSRVNNLENQHGGAWPNNPAAIWPRDFTCGTTLWIGRLISNLGEGVLKFFSRIVGNLENRRK